MQDTRETLSTPTISLHWLVAIGMIALTALGIYMEEAEAYGLYDIHKSFGALMLLLVLPRVVWRLRNGWPEEVGNYKRIEQWLSKVMHWLLILSTVLMPVSGILMSAAGGHGMHLFGLELMAETPDPTNAHEVIAPYPLLAAIGDEIHGTVGDILVFAIVLHVIGALKHHIVDGDETLRRMLGKQSR